LLLSARGELKGRSLTLAVLPNRNYEGVGVFNLLTASHLILTSVRQSKPLSVSSFFKTPPSFKNSS
jgi:hypothetical protein